MLLALAILAGCALPGEPSRPDTNALIRSTQAIALTYQADGDLAAAEQALNELEVANAHQWLILATETSIQRQDAAEVIAALVQLMQALELSSPMVDRYAQEHGLVESPAPPQEPPAVAGQPVATAEVAAEPPTSTAVPATPTSTVVPATPTPEPAEPTPTPAPAEPTPTPQPQVVTNRVMNVRAGPGINYPVVGSMGIGDRADITGKNPAGDWWQIEQVDGSLGWIYGPLVETSGDVGSVAVAASIPTPPPVTPTPTSPPAPTATPVPAGPDFRLVEQRLWSVEENGGFLAGESVNCGLGQVLRVKVIDANGNPLNGVTVKGVYRNEYHTTGEKGPGIAEFDVNVDGDDITVVKDVDGRDVTSDVATGNTARTWDIPFEQLIQGRYCKDQASCQRFVEIHGCYGHFSWTVVFQRNY